jgi:hypothetical protein
MAIIIANKIPVENKVLLKYFQILISIIREIPALSSKKTEED